MRVEFVRWKDPFVVTKADYTEESLEDESLQDLLQACASQPFSPAGAFVVTPMGMVPAAPHNTIGTQFNLWVMHSDGHLTPSVRDAITSVPGVEVYQEWTPYRAWIGFGRLFDHEKVKSAIHKALANGSA